MGLTAFTLAGHTATDASITIPAWGVSYADVSLDGELTLTGRVTLVVADLTLQATVLAGGPAQGRSFYRLVAGAGGWGKTIPRKSYSNDLGVKLSTVLGDAAAAVGETLDLTSFDTSTRLGPQFVRPEGPACRVLELVSPSAWYVREDGVTRLGARPSSTLAATAARTSQLDLARGTLTLASETIAGILPGLTVDGLTALDVEHEASAKGGLRSRIWGKQGGEGSRRLAAYRAIVDQIDPNRKFRGLAEYRVGIQDGDRLTMQAVRVSSGMPDLARVVMRPGISGASSTVQLGCRVLVGFVDADPARPVVVSFEEAEGLGWKPVSTLIDASGDLGLGVTASLVEIGSNSPSVTVGATPEAIGKSAGILTALAAIDTALLAIQTAMAAMTSGYSSLSGPQITAFNGAITAVGTALLTAAPASIPTTVLQAT